MEFEIVKCKQLFVPDDKLYVKNTQIISHVSDLCTELILGEII